MLNNELPETLRCLLDNAAATSNTAAIEDLEAYFELLKRACSLRRQAIEDRLEGFITGAVRKEDRSEATITEAARSY